MTGGETIRARRHLPRIQEDIRDNGLSYVRGLLARNKVWEIRKDKIMTFEELQRGKRRWLA